MLISQFRVSRSVSAVEVVDAVWQEPSPRAQQLLRRDETHAVAFGALQKLLWKSRANTYSAATPAPRMRPCDPISRSKSTRTFCSQRERSSRTLFKFCIQPRGCGASAEGEHARAEALLDLGERYAPLLGAMLPSQPQGESK